jgi:catechol 2,3-dioxygenase-like lactoylglutathione lyase family enzyme
VITGIDHVVLAVPDPDGAVAGLEEALGLRASEGGRHDRLGTFNRLVWLGDSYLELIGVFDPSLAADTWLGRPVLATLETGGGLATWAVAVDDLDAELRWARSDGELTAPIHGERRRPDGGVVRWRLAHPSSLSPRSPFLIEHDATSAEWTADDRRIRAAEAHPVGGRVRLASIEIQADIPAASAAHLRSLLATTAEPDGRRAVRVAIGSHSVRVAAQGAEGTASSAIELVTDVPLRRRTIRLGDCEIRLRGLPPGPPPRSERR